ncbi:MAG: hypothetical protein OEZ36_07545 [Spirochaetota bacterium]|nr:hypothetical protein [Spirochaetota bacterium]
MTDEFNEMLTTLKDNLDKTTPNPDMNFVISVDLCGSTKFKKDNPETWYPRINCFLNIVTRVFDFSNESESIGLSFLKFMGDELFYTINVGNNDVPHEVARKIILTYEYLYTAFKSLNDEKLPIFGGDVEFKMVFDFGEIYPIIPVADIKTDIVGETMDRMARIAKYAVPNFIIFSGQAAKLLIDNKTGVIPTLIKTLSPNEAKGIDENIDIYTYKGLDDEFKRKLNKKFYHESQMTREFYLRFTPESESWK